MFLNEITEWVGNWFWDTLYYIFIRLFDWILYALVGFFYKVFIILGTIDIFGGNGNGNKAALELYKLFTNRLYGAIGIMMVFVLAYQIILFIINPDGTMSETKKLIKNLVKGIVLTALCPLLFHYMALIQKHVMYDNTIWSIVLGTNSTSSADPETAGNAMAQMVYMTMFHPLGTDYNDFYDSTGKLKPYNVACKPYAQAYGADTNDLNYTNDGQQMADTSISHAANGMLLGTLFGGPGIGTLLGGTIGAIEDAVDWVGSWFKEEDKRTSCQYYWWVLYVADGGKSAPGTARDMHMYSTADGEYVGIGYTNGALSLTTQKALIYEIEEEGTMEYLALSPIVGALLVFMLVGYSLDMAYRAFKLAFLQMISPIPILLGVIPKQEKIYDKWKNELLKTYLDLFVKTFVMAFTVFMVQLVPTFVGALFEGLEQQYNSPLLKCVVTAFLVLGLIRFAKELPQLIKDMASGAGGLLSGLDINPLNSYKKAGESLKTLGKPIGAAAGAIAGGAGAYKQSKKLNPTSSKNNTLGNMMNRTKNALTGWTGAAAGAKAGWKNGAGLKSATAATEAGITKGLTRQYQAKTLASALKNVGKEGGVSNLLGFLTNGKTADFASAWNNKIINPELKAAATKYRDFAAGGRQFAAGADGEIDAIKARGRSAIDKIHKIEGGTEAAAAVSQKYNSAFGAATTTGSLDVNGMKLTGTPEEVRSKLSGMKMSEADSRERMAHMLYGPGDGAMQQLEAAEKAYAKSNPGKNFLSSVDPTAMQWQMDDNEVEEFRNLRAGKTIDVDEAMKGFKVTGVSATVDDVKFEAANMQDLKAQMETARAQAETAALETRYVTEFEGETIEGSSFAECKKNVTSKQKERIHEEELIATSKAIEEGGIDVVQAYADKSQALDLRFGDILPPNIADAMAKQMASAFSTEFGPQLAKMLEVSPRIDGTYDPMIVEQALKSDKFKQKYTNRDVYYDDGERMSKEDMNKMISELVLAISKSQDEVAKQVKLQTDAITGTKTDSVGRAINNLTPEHYGRSGDSDKGDK